MYKVLFPSWKTPNPNHSPMIPPKSDNNDEKDVFEKVVLEIEIVWVGTMSMTPLYLTVLETDLSLNSLKKVFY